MQITISFARCTIKKKLYVFVKHNRAVNNMDKNNKTLCLSRNIHINNQFIKYGYIELGTIKYERYEKFDFFNFILFFYNYNL